MKIKIKRDYTKTKSKLAFVKMIKDITGLGLKDSKWKADELDGTNDEVPKSSHIHIDVISNDPIYTFDYIKDRMEDFGYIVSLCRNDIINSIINSSSIEDSKFIINVLTSKFSYILNVFEGSIDKSERDYYTINVIDGNKEIEGSLNILSNVKITIPKNIAILEDYTQVDENQ